MEIKPLESFCVGIEGGKNEHVILVEKVRQLEADYKEAIDIIKNTLKELDGRFCFTGSHGTMQKSYTELIGIIEKAYNAKWEDIKED